MTDNFLGDLSGIGTCNTSGVIAAGSSYTCEYSANVSGNAGDVITRTASIILEDPTTNTLSKTDSTSVAVLDVLPSSSVAVTANPTSITEGGEAVTYSINVTNTTIEDVILGSLTANLGGDLNGMGTCTTGGVIPVGGTYSCAFSGILNANAGEVVSNTITAEVMDDESNTGSNSGSGAVTVTDAFPSIAVSVSATPLTIGEGGELVNYSISINNFSVEDISLSGLNASFGGNLDDVGTCNIGITIPVGGTHNCGYSTLITGNAGDIVINSVTVNVQDDEANTATNSSGATVSLTDVLPSIAVSVSPNPATVTEPGDTVTYNVNISNTSVEPVTLTQLSDSVSGNLDGVGTCALGGTISAGTTYTCLVNVYISGNAGDTFSSTVTANAADDEGNSATHSSNAVVTVSDGLPTITASVSPSSASVPEPGATVTYTVTIDNTSPEAVSLTALADDVYGNLAGQGSCTLPQTIIASGSFSCSFDGTVSGNAADSTTNTITASADDDEGNTATDSGSTTVTVTDVLPTITASVSPSSASVPEPGAIVTYTVTIDNTSPEAVSLTSLTDDVYGNLAGKGNCTLPQTIATGGSYSCAFDAAVSGNAADSTTNTITASADDDEGNNTTGNGSTTVTVSDVLPTITASVSPSSASVPEPGATVTYTVIIDNTSPEAVSLTSLTDDINGNLDGLDTCNLPQTIEAGGSYSCSFDATVLGNATDSTTNTVTARADDDEVNTAIDSGSATVTITDLLPTITVSISPSSVTVPEPGATVTYTILINNSSIESVALTSLTDDVYGNLAGRGTCILPQEIVAGGSYSCAFDAAVSGNATDSTTNTVIASADDDESNTATDTASVTVTVTNVLPTITISITPSSTTVPEPGDIVTYTVTVNNTSPEAVSLTALTDDVNGNLAGQGTCTLPQTITAGGSYACSFDATVSGNATASTTNTVTASADDDEGNTATDSTSATVTVTDILPTITASISPSSATVPEPGATVTHTITIDNTSPEAVSLISLTDDVNGDLAGQGSCTLPQAIAAGGSFSCSFDATVSGNATDSTTNTVTASADDDESNTTTDSASATITITDVLPTITISVSASSATVPEPGATATYTVTVDNTSPEAVSLTSLTDDVNGSLTGQGTCTLPQTITAGGSYSCSFDAAVSGNATDLTTNTVTASADDDEGNTASNSGSATVTITDVLPSITVSMSPSSATVPEPGTVVTYTVIVNNTSPEDVSLTSLTDDVNGNLSGQGTCTLPQTIAAGGSYSCSFDATVSGNATDSTTNTVTASADDDEGNTATDSASATVTVTDVLPIITASVSPSAATVPEPGATVTYTVLVNNLSVESITLISLEDDVNGNLAGQGTCSLPQAISSGGSYSCSFDATVSGNAADSTTNTVIASADDDEGNTTSDNSSATVTVTDVLPTITIYVLPSSATVQEPGAFVTYTITIDNTSPESVILSSLIDDVSGNLEGQGTCALPQTITTGGSYSCAFDAAVSGNATDTITNTVIASANDDEGNTATSSGSATVTVTDVLPTITLAVTSSENSVPEPGATVTYTVTVDNTSPEGVSLTSLIDDTIGSLASQGTCSLPQVIATGSSYSCAFDAAVSGNAGDSTTNTVTVSADDDEGNTATDTASTTVNVNDVPPTFSILKETSASDVNEPGDNITFTITINNTSPETITLNTLEDDQIGALDGIGTCSIGGTITIGGSYSCVYSAFVGGTAGDTYTNTVTGQIQDDEGNLASKNASAIVNILAVETVTLSGAVREDTDVDGNLSDPDLGIQGVTLELDDGTCLIGSTCETVITNANGSYAFSNILPGNYTIIEYDLPGYTSTNDTDGANDNQISLTVVSGIDISENDFLDTTEFANIYGRVRDDSDGDGDLGDNDAGLEGVVVELSDGTCSLGVDCVSTTTDQNGNYQFLDLLPGDYLVFENDPAGYLSTADSDPPNDNQIRITIIRGFDSYNNYFLDMAEPTSCTPPDPVNGYVISSVPVNGATTSINTTTVEIIFNQAMSTTGGGSVEDPAHFDGKIVNLTSGGDVPILTADYNAQTKTTTLTIDTSDPNWLPGSEYQIKIRTSIQNGCGTTQGLDVLRNFYTQGAISGQVRNDIDGDGDLGDGDVGISGVTLELENGVCAFGSNCPTATTNSNGDYLFTDLPAGNYIVHQNNLPDFSSTADQDGGNPDQVNVVLGDHQSISLIDFLDIGSSCAAPIPGTGFVSNSDPASNEVVSFLTTTLKITFNQAMSTGAGSVLDLGNFDNKIRNLTKGADVNLLAVSYDGNTQTATLTIDTSDPDWLPGANYRIRVKSQIANACETSQGLDVDIPFSTMSTISGFVRNDLDADGNLGDGDKGIYGATIELETGTCILGVSCPLITTGLDGYFQFLDLPSGSYVIHQADLPGFASTADIDGGDSNQISVPIGAVQNITDRNFLDTAVSCIPADPVNGYISSTIPASNQTLVSISTNSIKIKFNQPMYTDGGGSVLDIGNYHNNIDNLDLGGDVPYTGIVYDPNTYTVTLTLDTNDTSWAPGSWYEIRIDNGLENACKTDQGIEVQKLFQTTSSISGQARMDTDSDGDLTDNDSGIQGARIELFDGTCILGVNCQTTTTNANGFYIFPYVAPGSYTVFEYNLPGYTSTADAQGPNDDQINLTLLPGVISTRNDFLDTGP